MMYNPPQHGAWARRELFRYQSKINISVQNSRFTLSLHFTYCKKSWKSGVGIKMLKSDNVSILLHLIIFCGYMYALELPSLLIATT